MNYTPNSAQLLCLLVDYLSKPNPQTTFQIKSEFGKMNSKSVQIYVVNLRALILKNRDFNIRIEDKASLQFQNLMNELLIKSTSEMKKW